MQRGSFLHRLSWFSFPSLALLVAASIMGCNPPAAGDAPSAAANDNPDAVAEPSGGTETETGSGTGSEAPPQKEITVRLADRTEYDAVIAGHKGEVVLVDFWATWCGPCVEQFPHTVEMGEKYADAGLAVVTVSVDEADNKDNVLAFLKEKHAAFDNLQSKNGIDEVVVKSFEIVDGAVPHYKLYDRTGKLRYLFGGLIDEDVGETPDKIEIRIKELLEEKPDGEAPAGSE